MRYQKNLKVEGDKVYSYRTHVATIQGRKLYQLGYWSATTQKHINHVAREYGLELVKDQKPEAIKEDRGADMLKTCAMVAAFGNLLCNKKEDKIAWKKKFLAMTPGIDFPEDFDSLPEEEKQKRLDGAINIGLNKEVKK